MKLPLSTRQTLAAAFGIIKKGSTEVFNNEVKSDGYVLSEVEGALNIDAIQKYTGSNSSDFQVLWDTMVAKAEGRVIAPPTPPTPSVPEKKKRGRPRKNV